MRDIYAEAKNTYAKDMLFLPQRIYRFCLSVGICTFVLELLVYLSLALARSGGYGEETLPERQYLYFCTSITSIPLSCVGVG
jgi:hypothetical protein